ncbi:MAG: hypothetical protein JSR55_08755 [Proteobacteria bacterium]|nr:hypothetical protein [Pseudomonadota bacterium]
MPVGANVLITGDPGPANAGWLRAHYGSGVHIIRCAPHVVLAAIERRFRDAFRERAITGLARSEPQFSASTVITRGQIVVFGAAAALALLLLALWPQASGILLTVLFGVLFVANAGFRAVLLWIGAEERRPPHELAAETLDLPVYSILVPLYREANVMPALVRALRALDYPGIR